MAPRAKIEELPDDVRRWLERALTDGNFSGYKVLEKTLKAKGYDIGKSSIHRFGQKIERRFAAIKASTEAARMLTEGASDDKDARSEAIIALVQTELFESIVNLQEADAAEDQGKRLGLLSAAAKNISTLTRASVTLKRYQAEHAEKLATEASAAAVAGATAEGLTPEQAARVGAAVANRIQIYLPANGR